MKHLFDDNTEKFSDECIDIGKRIFRAIKPFVEEAKEKNWSLRDLELLIQSEVGLLISSEILRKCCKEYKRKVKDE